MASDSILMTPAHAVRLPGSVIWRSNFDRAEDAGPLQNASREEVASEFRSAGSELILRCPSCGASAGHLIDLRERRDCERCAFVFLRRDGILRALLPDRRKHYENFLREYGTIRDAEGRGSDQASYYLALPHRDLSGKYSDQWSIRGRSYRYFERRILPMFERGRSLSILDLGAGNGWMSYRLALRNHRPVAIDIFTDDRDGLGAARHFHNELRDPFPLIEAEFDRLPFQEGQFDLAVFNSSLHYSADYAKTLSEAWRCLRRQGSVVVLDSPVYGRREHGVRMREDRHRYFESVYGFRSDSIASIEFLDEELLRELESRVGFRWRILKPWYGLKWHLRPWRAKLRRDRPPSRFRVLVGSRRKS